MFITKTCDNSPKAINILAKEKSGLQNCAKGAAERKHGRALHPQPSGSSTPSGPGSRWLSQPYCPLWISSTWSGISLPDPATSWKLVNCFSNASCLEEFTALSQTLWLRKYKAEGKLALWREGLARTFTRERGLLTPAHRRSWEGG